MLSPQKCDRCESKIIVKLKCLSGYNICSINLKLKLNERVIGPKFRLNKSANEFYLSGNKIK